jgi:hypothetical protein
MKIYKNKCHALVAVAFIFFNTVFCMNKENIFLPQSTTAQAILFLTTEKIYLFDHETILNLGITKDCDKTLRHSAHQRRKCLAKHLSKYAQSLLFDRYTAWYKYGTSCAIRDRQDIVLFSLAEDGVKPWRLYYGYVYECKPSFLTDWGLVYLRFSEEGCLKWAVAKKYTYNSNSYICTTQYIKYRNDKRVHVKCKIFDKSQLMRDYPKVEEKYSYRLN